MADDERSRSRKRSGRDRRRSGGRSWLGLVCLLLIVALLGGYGAFVWHLRPSVDGDALRLDEFAPAVEDGRIRDATFLDADSIVTGTYERPDGTTARYKVVYGGSGRGKLTDLLLSADVRTTVEQQFLKQLFFPATILVASLVMVIIFIYLILSYRRGTGVFGLASGARRTEPDEAEATFTDVAGQEEAVTELRELAAFLAEPERFTELGATVPKGVLIYGPPGCGKTLLARALAGEAGAAFYSISGSDFVELYVGVGASRVRDLFSEARENAPAIVFIDELDAIGRRRGAGGGGTTAHEEQEQTLNQILTEMDGFSPSEGVIVVAATNRPDVLDQALLRPGRFDRSVGMERPDEEGRLAILATHAAGKPLAADVDLAAVANRAVGLTGADLAGVVNEAALLAARAGRSALVHADLDAALTRLLEAPERQRRLALRDRSIGAQALETERVGFDAIAGAEEAVAELAEVRDYLADPERFAAMGARMPRGFLLSGPPGCGKTLLARAVAGEANAAFLSVAATEFTEVYVGEGAARARDLFAQARAMAPAIVFLDELDAIGARRGAGGEGHRERDQTLNQILTELDGFGARTGVVVMAATNRPDILDPALIRPGRFDRRVAIDLPDRTARRAILEVHAQDKPLAADVDLDAVAVRTRGLSGADLANTLNEAALLAARRGQQAVTMALMEEALERASFGVARSRVLSEDQRRKTAYHEAGHALVARSVAAGLVPHKVSLVARGHLLGATFVHEEREGGNASRSQLLGHMAAALGGRTAELLVYGEADAGAAHDLTKATSTAYWMVTELGMTGTLAASGYHRAARPGGLSDETAAAVDRDVDALVAEAGELARVVLEASLEGLDAVAEALVAQETVNAEELDALAGPPASPNGHVGRAKGRAAGRQAGKSAGRTARKNA